jgi:hypothetical protein
MLDNTVMIETCNTCGVTLDDSNWQPSWKALGRTQCKNCCNPNRLIKNPTRMYVNGKYISRKHPLYKPGRYKSFGDAAFSALQKDKQILEGYVYAIRNKAWPDWIKIGKAVDAEDRLNGYQTSSPMRDYELIHSVYFDDRNKAERDAHKVAERKGERKGEWFKLTKEQALEVLREVTLD